MLPVSVVERMKPGQLLQHYLMASYCYYHLNESPMADSTYDRLCQRLAQVFDSFDHPQKHIVSKDDITDGGTGFYIRAEDYPRMVVQACQTYDALCLSGQMADRLEPHLLPVSNARARRRPPPVQSIAAPVVAQRVRRAPPAAKVESQPTAVRIVRRVRR